MIDSNVTTEQLKAVVRALGYELDTDSEKWPARGPRDGDYRWMGSWLLLRRPWAVIRARFHWSLTERQKLEQAVLWALGLLVKEEHPCIAGGHRVFGWHLHPTSPECEQDAKNARREVG